MNGKPPTSRLFRRRRLFLCFTLLLWGSASSWGGSLETVPFRHRVIDDTVLGHRQVADIDGDGLNDIVAADFNGDGRLDIAVSEERYPGLEPNASLYWFEQPESAMPRGWKKHMLVTEYSLNSLGTADLDRDGDMELVTNEHKGKIHKTQIFENDGRANFTEHLIDAGKEMHLGCVLGDLYGDGDLDMAGVPWDDYQYLHVWRNDAVSLGPAGRTRSHVRESGRISPGHATDGERNNEEQD